MSCPEDQRRALMRLAALATPEELRAGLASVAPRPAYQVVRAPEIGLVMIEGRMGGDGARFNLGEAVVTRAVVRLETGELGFSYLLGRRGADAEHAALIDALAQRPDGEAALTAGFVAPVTARLAADAQAAAAAAAATRVSFFTLERGESPS